MRAGALSGAVGTLAVAGWLLSIAAAHAQDVRVTAPAPSSADNPELTPLTPEQSDVLERALRFDTANLTTGKSRTLRLPGLRKSGGLDVNRTDKPDGSSTVAVKHALPTDLDAAELDTKVGADLNLAAPPETVYQPGKPLPSAASNDAGSGAAWASLGLPNLASIHARVDPANDRGKIGGTLKRALPVGKKLTVTLEDSYAMTESFSQPATAAPSVAPPTAPPGAAPPGAAPPGAAQVFDTSRSVKLNIGPTGTTFGAGMTTASNDPITHNTLSADQKLFGPLHVTTALTDVGQPTENKSITAAFKLNW